MTNSPSVRVLMVCTGNICRSPSAEGVLRHMLVAEGLFDRVTVDSAGTTSFHKGEGPSRLAVVAAAARGYDFSGLVSRPLRPSDYTEFDLILAMDDGHKRHLDRARPDDAPSEVAMFLDAAPEAGRPDVPDPYYGGGDDYEYALDLIETGCRGWVRRFKARFAEGA
jgi:protein-tyrosine phosphatase